MIKPLAGVRVIDFTSTISGPFCGSILADYGADVIKIERPDIGEDGRHFPPLIQNYSVAFAAIQRQKKGLSLALGEPEAQELFRKLAAKSDVVLENFTPGTMKRWNIDFETIKKINPKIVYCSISAFGQFGPMSSFPGYDGVIQALSGLMYGTGFPDGPPTRTGNASTDYLAGTYAAFSIAMGLFHALKTGEALHMDISMMDCILTTMDTHFSQWVNAGEIQPRYGNRLPYVSPFDTFQTKDGWAFIATANNNTFQALCDAMQRPDLIEEPHYRNNSLRCQYVAELKSIIEEWTKKYQTLELINIMRNAGVPCAPVQSIGEMLEHPHTKARGMIQEVVQQPSGLRVKMPGVPIKINGEVATIPENAYAPEPGEHNREILTGILGLSNEDLIALKEKKVI